VGYTDPFQNLNDIKRQEREALLNNSTNAPSVKSPAIASLISRRDYFAAAALQGILAAGESSLLDAAERSFRVAGYLIGMFEMSEEKA
jgi:hypothetical protein